MEELLELPDELRVHSFHQGSKALVPHQGLLRLQLFIDKLLERNAVHRILQGQLQEDKENGEWKNYLSHLRKDLLGSTLGENKNTSKSAAHGCNVGLNSSHTFISEAVQDTVSKYPILN